MRDYISAVEYIIFFSYFTSFRLRAKKTHAMAGKREVKPMHCSGRCRSHNSRTPCSTNVWSLRRKRFASSAPGTSVKTVYLASHFLFSKNFSVATSPLRYRSVFSFSLIRLIFGPMSSEDTEMVLAQSSGVQNGLLRFSATKTKLAEKY